MKTIYYLLALTILLSALSYGQTAFTDSGTVNFRPPVKEFVVNGVVKGTDTLISKTFDYFGYNRIVDVAKYMTSVTDSAKIKILRQANWFGTTWTTVKTLEDSDKVRTVNVKFDTLYYTPNAFRFVIIGVSGNGDSTGFYIKLRSATP